MIEHPSLVLGLAGLDLLIVAALWLVFWLGPRPTHVGLIPIAFGLSGFVFHAVLFFDGAFLFLQLATYGSVFGLSALVAFRQQRQH
jgi:hypothetical protein